MAGGILLGIIGVMSLVAGIGTIAALIAMSTSSYRN